MWKTPKDNENQPGIAERRLSARRRVMSLAYIDLDGSNGGIIVDIGEDGLEVAAAAPMELGPLPRMRFQMPESSDWVEADGEITWVSESKKEASIRFVNLPEDARNRIRNWVSAEASPGESESKTSTTTEGEKQPSVALPAREPMRPIPKFTAMSAKAQEEIRELISAVEADAGMRATEAFAASPAPPEEQFPPENPLHPWDSVVDADRRRHPRRRITSLAYVDLGGSNGGIILNVSELGMVVATATPVEEGLLAKMRFQLPGTNDWIEANGEIIWVGKSKREAGIRFVDLSPDAREQIKGWVSLEERLTEPRPERPKGPEKPRRLLEMPDVRAARIMPFPPVSSQPVIQVRTSISAINARAAAALEGATVRAAMPSTPAPGPGTPTEKEIAPEAVAGERAPNAVPWRSWPSLAAMVIAVAFASFLVGWFAAGRTTRNKMLAAFGRQTVESTGPNLAEKPHAVGITANAPSAAVPNVQSRELVAKSPPARISASAPGPPNKNAPAGAQTSKLAPASTTANVPSPPVATARQQMPAAEQNSASAVRSGATSQVVSGPPQSANGASSPPKEVVAAAPNPKVNQPEPERAPEASNIEIAPPPKPVENPDVFKGSVSVSFSPYPSIRIPAELRSQMAKQGASLQIGQLVTRVDPVYPEDAEKHHIEGTVKLHVIIGRDGAVESAELIGGPEPLAPAATSAARQWRYKPASIAGQPVEAEQDVTMVFRLVKQTAQPK